MQTKEKLREELKLSILNGLEEIDISWVKKINNLINTIKIKES